MALDKDIIERIEKLEHKYAVMGQDLRSYLDGLLHADYTTYWDYIHLDTLLSLQTPLTSFPDEKIFIMYHQITELYFKLILHEIEQLSKHKEPSAKMMINHLTRVNRYFENLTHSFTIMVDGLDKTQFLQFRMSLLPASGFQSAQYRMIEIVSTEFTNLVLESERPNFTSKSTIEEMFEHIYWNRGATELATGKKTLTLKQFENKYKVQLLRLANVVKDRNIWKVYKSLPAAEQANEVLINTLKLHDLEVNVNWPLSHYRSAVKHLHRDPKDIAATGGTNWQKYLPPRFQRTIFYPELWTETQRKEWGKTWVHKVLSELKGN